MFLIVCTENPEQLLLCASIVDFDVILLGVPSLQNSFRRRRFENDTLNISCAAGLPILGDLLPVIKPYNEQSGAATSPESLLLPFYSFYSLSCRTVCSCLSANPLPCGPLSGESRKPRLKTEVTRYRMDRVRGVKKIKKCFFD